MSTCLFLGSFNFSWGTKTYISISRHTSSWDIVKLYACTSEMKLKLGNYIVSHSCQSSKFFLHKPVVDHLSKKNPAYIKEKYHYLTHGLVIR
jgi:hypothetical protein